MLKRDNLAAPERRTEACPVAAPPFGGGEVAVRQLTLTEWQACEQASAAARDLRLFPHLLAAAVVDADGLPVWTAEQWDLWAVQHTAAFGTLLEAVLRVNGRADGDAKNA
jgi:hypothetical protein